MSFLIGISRIQQKLDEISNKFIDDFSNRKAVRAIRIGKNRDHSKQTIIEFDDGTFWASHTDLNKYCHIVTVYWLPFFEGLQKLGLLTKEEMQQINQYLKEVKKTEDEMFIRRDIGSLVRKVGKNKVMVMIREYNADMEIADNLYRIFISEYSKEQKREFLYKHRFVKWLAERAGYANLPTEGRRKEIVEYFLRRTREEFGIN